MLRKALGDAVRKRLIVRNPTDYATPPKQSSSHGQALTRDEAAALLGALYGHRLELPVRIALFTGLRLGEVLGLTWRHVDLPESGPGRLTVAGIVSETKGPPRARAVRQDQALTPHDHDGRRAG